MILSLNHYIFRAYNEGKSCCSKNTERNEIGMGSHGPGLRSSRGRHCHHSSSFGLSNWQLWNQAATFRINNKCENLIFKPLSLIYQAASWSTTLPTLKIQTTLYTKLSTVPWNVLSTQTQLVVLSSGAGTTRTRRATQKLRTLGELWRQQVEPRLAQWNVDHQEEQARISLLKI